MAAPAAGLLLAAALAAAPAPLPAQEVDSLAALRQARAAQAAFERFRYHRLPRTHARASGPCTERIGRWCFWFEPESADGLPEEPAEVAERRGLLVYELSTAAESVPGEPWIVGQLVRYLVESGDVQGAVAVARGCRAERWWCLALEGYALHQGGRWPDAERVYAAALESMPEEERARWTDPTLLLRPDDRRALRRMDDAERAEAERRLWWLADPLWSEPGNDRLTEHYVRWTIDRMQERARQVERTSWSDDSREVLVRYGWFTGWERYQPLIHGWTGEGSVVSYTADRSWEWLPPLSTARDPATLRGDVFPLGEETPTATRYAPEYLRRVLPLAHQLALFRRGGSAVLVAGYVLPADSFPADARLRAAAVAMTGPDAPLLRSRWEPTAPSGALFLELPAAPAVVSLEVREDSTRTLARWRQAVAPDPRAPISDLLLLAHADARPTELEEAARISRGSTEVRAGETVGVYWEMYDLPATDSLTIRLGLVAPRASWVRRRLQAIGVAGAPRPVRMRVGEETPGGSVVGRSLAVALPRDLRPGDYTLEVTVTAPGRPPATTRRVLSVVR